MIAQIIIVVVLALIVAGLVAPTEAVNWWRRGHLGEQGIQWPTVEEAFQHADDEPDEEVPDELPAETDHYLVYLSGIGISSPHQLPVVEIPMVQRLTERIGGTMMVWRIYPYSVANTALTQGRLLSRLWRKLAQWKFERHPMRWLAFLINLRNAFQIFVSADQRYGPVFNLAIAQQIAAALIRSGYQPANRKPVTLLGWSGGAQIAAGAAYYLAALGMPVRILSMAGILSSDPGLDRVQDIWHLRGDTDKLPNVGAVLSMRRWPIFPNSEWNRAKRDGRLKLVSLGDLRHTGPGGYFASEPLLPDGRQPRQLTADYILEVLVDAGLATDNFADRPDVPRLGQPDVE
ncbi:MAG: hypothetical protein WBL05_03770 [Brooklawnia sp.]|uniref:hypothetical protein n=1 Tax=Brooklawnia sp. TaxID=2699740 RepID=UPI003C78523D